MLQWARIVGRKRSVMGKLTLFIDFDGTLFNAKDFKPLLFNYMAEVCGVSLEKVEDAYRSPEVYGQGTSANAGPRVQLGVIAKQNPELMAGKDISVLMDRVTDFVASNARDYVFQAAAEQLHAYKAFDSCDFELRLITVGGEEYQRLKVENSGLLELFEAEPIYITEPKQRAMLKTAGNAQFILLDDSDHEVDLANELSENDPHYVVLGKKVSDGALPDPQELWQEFSVLKERQIRREGMVSGERVQA